MITTGSAADAVFQAPSIVRALLGFGLGAIAGSFMAVILLRWPRGDSVLTPRSRCEACETALRLSELVPLLSYLAARGKCRRCGARIDQRHLLMELAAASLGAVAVAVHPGPMGLATALFGWWLLILAALDAEHHWLPDRLTLPMVPAGLVVAAVGFGPALDDRLIGAAAGFLTLAGIAVAYRVIRKREGMGGGDPKLLAGLGAWLGWQQLPFLLLGSGLLGLAALLLARSRGSVVAATDRLPLGSLMAVSAWPIWLVVTG